MKLKENKSACFFYSAFRARPISGSERAQKQRLNNAERSALIGSAVCMFLYQTSFRAVSVSFYFHFNCTLAFCNVRGMANLVHNSADGRFADGHCIADHELKRSSRIEAECDQHLIHRGDALVFVGPIF